MNKRLERYRERVEKEKGKEYLKEYTLIGNYTTMKTKTKFRHNKCGYEWKTSPDNFLRTKNGCPRCAGNKRTDTEEFKQKVKEIAGDTYEVLGEYTNAREHIRMLHKVCGKEWEVTPYSFTGLNTRCPHCNGGVRHTQETFIEVIRKRYEDKYEVLGEYVNNRTPIEVRHKECGEIWEPYPDNLMRGNECPNCFYRSKGEALIADYLDSKGVEYEREKTFLGLYHLDKDRPLRADFYIAEANTIIEYDGIQHFEPVELFGGVEAHELTVIKDRKKNDYAKDNGITMVRIPYTMSVEEIEKEISKLLVKK